MEQYIGTIFLISSGDTTYLLYRHTASGLEALRSFYIINEKRIVVISMHQFSSFRSLASIGFSVLEYIETK